MSAPIDYHTAPVNEVIAYINLSTRIVISGSIAFGIVAAELIGHLPKDVSLVRDWRWVNLLYFICRWSGVATSASYVVISSIGANKTGCQTGFEFMQVMFAFVSVSASCIFYLRLVAIWNFNRVIAAALGVYLVGMFSFQVYAAFDFFAVLQSPFGHIVCDGSVSNRNQGLCWFLTAIFDTVVLCLAVLRLYKRQVSSEITRVLLRDNAIYYGIITALYIITGSLYYANSDLVAEFVIGQYTNTLSSVVACRVFHNLASYRTSGDSSASVTPRAEVTSTSAGRGNPRPSFAMSATSRRRAEVTSTSAGRGNPSASFAMKPGQFSIRDGSIQQDRHESLSTHGTDVPVFAIRSIGRSPSAAEFEEPFADLEVAYGDPREGSFDRGSGASRLLVDGAAGYPDARLGDEAHLGSSQWRIHTERDVVRMG